MVLEHQDVKPKRERTVHSLELPTIIFGPVEVRRLQRELEALEDFLQQAAIRDPGKQPHLPRTSRILEVLAETNKLNLLLSADQQHLSAFLKDVATKAPVIHMSFAADPSATFTAKIVTWLRANIHPYALVQLGLQPTIAAGCIVRTTNKTFDFSLRNRLRDRRSQLVRSLDTEDAVQNADPAMASAETPHER